MALQLNSITLDDTGLQLTNAYLRIYNFQWNIVNPTKLTVVFGVWLNFTQYNSGKKAITYYTKDVPIQNYLSLFLNVRDNIYIYLKENDSLFENSILVD